MPLGSEQPDTTAQVYGLTGGHRFGNKSHILKDDEWNPQAAFSGKALANDPRVTGRHASEGRLMSLGESDPSMGFRRHLLDVIDYQGISDRQLSLRATGNAFTVRNMRRGTMPRPDTLEALCHTLGVRIQVVPLDEGRQSPEDAPSVEQLPDWPRQLRKEIIQDIAEILARPEKRSP